MRRALTFTKRNILELIRDPLSYIFAVGFPLVMLAMMTIINTAIPAGTMDLFNIDKLAPGILTFALSFVMLFATLLLTKDRSGAFLTRLYSSPMRPSDFIFGYIVALLPMVLGQFVVTYICSAIIALANGVTLSFGGIVLSCVVQLPCALFFISAGLLFGSLLNEKSAPPCSSIIISLCGVLGGIWFDLSILPDNNPLSILCRIFPFSHSVSASRAALSGDLDGIFADLIISLAWAAGMCIISIFVFGARMRSDNK